MKVKIITETNREKFEDNINRFLETKSDNQIIDIKISESEKTYTATIMYKK